MTQLLEPSVAEINADRWHDVAAVPTSRVRARLAHALLNRTVGRLPLRVRLPDGTDRPEATTRRRRG